MQTELIADITGERVDVFLTRMMPTHSRSFWQYQCQKGYIKVSDKEVLPKVHLKAGERVVITPVVMPDFSEKSLPIIYEDEDVLVVNKPAGMLTHAKGMVNSEFTVADFIRRYTTDGLATNRPGIVHRLDRGTSGVLIAAKNPEARLWLQKQFSLRKVKKTYTALVEGRLDTPSATINLPIERNPRKPQTFRVGANGKPAETTYKTIRQFKRHTLLAMQPKTGRTHQLRVHAAYIHHPIVGDAIYGHPDAHLSRIFLHASQLELTLPNHQRELFKAPLPLELETYLKNYA